MKLLSATMLAACLGFSGFATPAQATVAWCFPMPGFGWGPAYGWAAPPMYAPTPYYAGYAPAGYGNCCAPVNPCCATSCGDSCGTSCAGSVSSDKVPGPARDSNFDEKMDPKTRDSNETDPYDPDRSTREPLDRDSEGSGFRNENGRGRRNDGGFGPDDGGFGSGDDGFGAGDSGLGTDDGFGAGDNSFGAGEDGEFSIDGDGDSSFGDQMNRKPEMTDPAAEFDLEAEPKPVVPDELDPQARLPHGRLDGEQARISPTELRTRHRLTESRRTTTQHLPTRWSGRHNNRRSPQRWIGAPASDGRVRL